MHLLGLFTAFLIFISLASAAHPASCSGACNVHDPAVIRRTSDGTYFRFSTGNRIQIATASSLAGPWTIQGSAIPAGSIIDLDGQDNLWAPDVSNVGDYYYLYYSVSTFGSQNSAIGVARSRTMDVGTWTDLGSTGINSSTGSAYNSIDANLIATGGNYYMTFGSFWNDLYQVQMANPPVKIAGSSPYQVAFNSTGAHAIEGSIVFKHSRYFYLFFSSGTCCGYDSNRPSAGNEYRINVCRSTSIAGPYVDAAGRSCKSGGGTTVLGSQDWLYGPGGQGVFADSKSGRTILYYHYVDTRIGYADGQKRFGWNVLNWSGGWPTVA
ncbi:endo-1,5-arabinanase [Terfezia boudieri ATCC MYA-4762]|uniref:Arabinan endo-1,5-alpha-L-arabinosidase n=1 Tax=Terfezia boudieri ATCC MYA-4762 TaxID=1051890 RepID=A0A3N4LBK0_9PEZI|nr:endo-1,5-arabinanase [Terfezia boudieri ATCC MYA-4762]